MLLRLNFKFLLVLNYFFLLFLFHIVMLAGLVAAGSGMQ